MACHWPYGGLGDPGPCPVDDAPHTTCTSPGYAPGVLAVATVRRPAALDTPRLRDTAPAPEPEAAARTFTTKQYRRATHGRKLRGAKGGTRARY